MFVLIAGYEAQYILSAVRRGFDWQFPKQQPSHSFAKHLMRNTHGSQRSPSSLKAFQAFTTGHLARSSPYASIMAEAKEVAQGEPHDLEVRDRSDSMYIFRSAPAK